MHILQLSVDEQTKQAVASLLKDSKHQLLDVLNPRPLPAGELAELILVDLGQGVGYSSAKILAKIKQACPKVAPKNLHLYLLYQQGPDNEKLLELLQTVYGQAQCYSAHYVLGNPFQIVPPSGDKPEWQITFTDAEQDEHLKPVRTLDVLTWMKRFTQQQEHGIVFGRKPAVKR
jgi:hypothetical protein